MSKFLRSMVGLIITLGLWGLVAAPAYAAGPNLFTNACNGNTQAAVCSGQTTSDPLVGPDGVIGKVTKLIALFAGVVAVIMMIVGGFMYVISNGDTGKVSTAKDTLIYAGVGLIVIALGQTIIVFVIDRI